MKLNAAALHLLSVSLSPAAAQNALRGLQRGGRGGRGGLGDSKGLSASGRTRMIVTFDDDGEGPATKCAALARAAGGTVGRVFHQAMKGCTIDLPNEAVTNVGRNPMVKYMEPDQEVKAFDTIEIPNKVEAFDTIQNPTGVEVFGTIENPTWGLDRIDQCGPIGNTNPYEQMNAEGVRVYILDTGVQGDHPLLQPYMSTEDCHIDIVGERDAQYDGHGHGTHVAGAACGDTYGVATNCDICAVKVVSASGSASISDIIDGIEYVMNNCPAGTKCVANMSVRGGLDQAWNTAVANAVAAGVVFVVAAGNKNQDACGVSPPSATAAITVGSTDRNDQRSFFSNWGECVDVDAPGESITSTWKDGGTRTVSGTDYASAYVAGLAAGFMGAASSTLTPEQVWNEIEGKAKSTGVYDFGGRQIRVATNQDGCDGPTPPPTPPPPTDPPTPSPTDPPTPSPTDPPTPSPTELPSPSPTEPPSDAISRSFIYALSNDYRNFCGYDDHFAPRCNGRLASIMNSNELDRAKMLLARNPTVKVGGVSGSAWIGGMYDSQKSQWGWSDGTTWFDDNENMWDASPVPTGPRSLLKKNGADYRYESITSDWCGPSMKGAAIIILPADYDDPNAAFYQNNDFALCQDFIGSIIDTEAIIDMQSVVGGSSEHFTWPGNRVTGAAASALHEVRCCSDITKPGWIKNENCNVWAASEVPSCNDSKTLVEAESICTEAGGRLCTEAEILDDCTRGSGCMFDYEHVWTSSSMISPKVFLGCGHSQNSACTVNPSEAYVDEQHAVRCCADTNLGSDWKKHSACDVWAMTEFDGQCYPSETFPSAQERCAALNARLCTKDEVMSDCTEGTGCEFNAEMIWTSTPFCTNDAFCDDGLQCTTNTCGTDGVCRSEPVPGCMQSVVGGSSVHFTWPGNRVTGAAASSLHEVRCCSDINKPGWIKNENCNVWAESDVPSCNDGKTLIEAENICTDAGGRLCTEAEILDDCTKGSGCMFDYEYVWTSSTYAG